MMKHKADMDQLLKQALSPQEEPNRQLNQNIIRQAKEREEMGRKYFGRIPATAMIAAAVLLAGSVTAVAAWKYLTPDKVAEVMENKGLAAAFQGDDAIFINETQEYGNYKVTLLGIVSGKSLSEYLVEDEAGNCTVHDDRTYAVTAIENADGSPRPAVSDEDYGKDPFFVSPLIEGQDPAWYNSVTMNGGYGESVEDGIQYRITETDNVEMFADRPLYLAVNSGTFYDQEAYQYDEKSGKISRNEAYDGVNALFSLPLDPSKADREAADAYIRQIEEELFGGEDARDGAEGSEGSEDGAQEGGAAVQGEEAEDTGSESLEWTEEELEQKATLLDRLTQVLHPDEEGNISYSYEIEEDGAGSSGTIPMDTLFEEGETGMSEFKTISREEKGERSYIETYTRNEDGSVTLRVYQWEG